MRYPRRLSPAWLYRRFVRWQMNRRWRKTEAEMVKLVPTNRRIRRRDARKVAGRTGDRKAVYRALKARER